MRKGQIRFITVFFLTGIMVWMLVAKDRDYSERENRYLAKLPSVSVQSVLDGSFMDDWETYLSDQFPLRDWCVTLRSNALSLLGQTRINGVFIGSGGYLIPKDDEVDYNKIDEQTEAVNAAAEYFPDVNFQLMLAPGASYVCEDRLPAGIESTQGSTMDYVADRLSSRVDFVDVRKALLTNNTEQLYFRNDHHWTVYGAFEAFSEYMNTRGVKVDSKDFDFMTVADGFFGTQASNCGIYKTGDEVDICVPKGSEGTYTVNYINESIKTTTLFDDSKVDAKDKYLVFMGGNYSQVIIDTTANNGKRLLIVKDSYANCMIPMFTPYYERIVVVDPRYFYDNIAEGIVGNEVDDVLFLYSVNGFVTDTSLTDTLMLGEE